MYDEYKQLKYYIYYPDDYDASKPVRVLFDIHGAGRRGSNIEQIVTGGLEKYIVEGYHPECIVIAPQCHADCWFDLYEQLKEFITAQVERFHPTEVLLSGTSMGGYCAWQLLMSMPEVFRRAVICCGGGMYWNAGRIRAEVKAFHGKLDRTVLPEESVKMVNAVNSAGGRAECTLYDDLDHNCWDRVFGDRSIMAWLINGV